MTFSGEPPAWKYLQEKESRHSSLKRQIILCNHSICLFLYASQSTMVHVQNGRQTLTFSVCWRWWAPWCNLCLRISVDSLPAFSHHSPLPHNPPVKCICSDLFSVTSFMKMVTVERQQHWQYATIPDFLAAVNKPAPGKESLLAWCWGEMRGEVKLKRDVGEGWGWRNENSCKVIKVGKTEIRQSLP